jgi:hypothetical protein
MSFNNAKVSIPEVFRLKAVEDSSVQSLLKIASSEFLFSIERWVKFKETWKEVRNRQAELRIGCEKFIQTSRKN